MRPRHNFVRCHAARVERQVANAEALIWAILTIAEQKFRRLNSLELITRISIFSVN